MLKKNIFILFTFLYSQVSSQKENFNWIIGTPPVEMNFTDTNFTYNNSFHQTSGLDFFNTSFTQNDSAGNLLYYTNGAEIYDRNGNLMENGSGLNPSSYLSSLINSGSGNGFLQAAIGIKKPGSDSLYYLFHFGASDNCPGYPLNAALICKLFVTTIDMYANNGLGKVIQKNQPIMQDSVITGTELTLLKHGNGRDWWLIKHGGNNDNIYYKFIITPQAITGPFIQHIGSFPKSYSGTFGTATISPDGTKFAGVTYAQGINIFDVDRCTGLFSNPVSFMALDSAIEDTFSEATSLAFSPNGRFLYACGNYFIYQYDMTAADIPASRDTLITVNLFSSGDFRWLCMQLAADGKIYIGPYDWSKFLSVITEPDSPGMTCNLRPYSVIMPCASNDTFTCNSWAIPLLPQYRLPTMPIYLANAGNDKESCKDSTVQLGSTTLVNQLIYTWSSNDPAAFISDIHSTQPFVSTHKDSAQFYLLVTDTVSKHSCLDKIDTINVHTNHCVTGIVQTNNPIRIKYFPTLYVYDITPQTEISVYNLLGQLVYTSSNYQNDWDVRTVSNAVYVFQVKTPDGRSCNGRVVVMH